MSKQSGWVTINGVHVFIDGKSGKITQGPAKFIGSTLNDLPSNKSSQSDLKARLQAKHTTSDGKEVKPYTQNESIKDRVTSSVKKENIKRTEQAKVDLIDSKNRDLTDSQLKEKRRLVEEEMYDELSQTPSKDTGIVKGVYERAIKDIDTEISHRNRPNSSSNANKSGADLKSKSNKTGDIDSLIREAETKKDNLMKKWNELSGGNPVYKMTEEQKKLRSDITAAENERLRLVFAKQNGISPKANSDKALAQKSQTGLTVVHYDGFGRKGSWNEYRINGKRVSAKEAKAAFPSQFEGGRYVGTGKSNTGNSLFGGATSTTKAKVAKNPNSRLHTGRVSSKGNLTPKQQKLFRQYVGSAGQGMSGNEALKIAISGKLPTTQTDGGAVAPTSSRQSNSARVSNTKTMGEFLRATRTPATARTRNRGRNK